MAQEEIVSTPHDRIQYREYKMLLKADHFQTRQAFVDFWEIVKSTAGKFDVHIHENEDPFHCMVREVLFYDTEDFDLYRNHFIVRLRTHYENGWPEGIPELTVKFRHPEFKESAAVNVRPATPGGMARIKFKEELLPLKETLGGIRSIFSHNCVLAMPREALNMAAGDLLTFFPGLRRVQTNEEVPIKMVNDTAVTEVQVDVGKLGFGKHTPAKTSIAVWRNRKFETAFCGEFAFQMKFDTESELHRESLKRAEDFYKTLQLDCVDWISLGSTKTAAVYQFNKSFHGTHSGE